MNRICPMCNSKLSVQIPYASSGPAPGDVTVCSTCDHVLEFTERLGLIRCEDPAKVLDAHERRRLDDSPSDDAAFRFQCGNCMAILHTPEALLTHMMETGHNMDETMRGLLQSSPELRAELMEKLGGLLEDPHNAGDRVDELDLPQEALDALARARAHEATKKKGWFH